MRSTTRRAAAFTAGLVVPATFGPSLLPRTSAQQGLVTGLSALATYAASAVAVGAVSGGAAARGRPAAGQAGGLAAGLVTQMLLRRQQGEPLRRAAARTAAYELALGSAAGLAVTGIDRVLPPATPRLLRGLVTTVASVGGAAVLSRVDRPEQAERRDAARGLVSAGVVAGAGLALATAEQAAARGAGRVMARVLPGPPALWSAAGQAAVAGAGAYAVVRAADRAMARMEQGAERTEPGLDTPPDDPYVSGGPRSLVAFSALTREGRRHVLTRTRTQFVERVMETTALAEPVRVFVGLDCAPTVAERVDLTLAEMYRLVAFERAVLLLVSPTGTGYVNYAAVEAVEYLTLGDVATVTMQYSLRPSFLSLDQVHVGREQNRLLWQAIADRLAARPSDERPRVLMFGESLGAHTAQDAVLHEGTAGLQRLGVDSAIWIGTPYASRWKDEVLAGPAPDVDPALVGVFTDIEAYRALPQEERDRLRYVMITHAEDGVPKFGYPLAVQAPPWLSDGDGGRRSPGVPARMRWYPFTTFFAVFVDMLNGSDVTPGQFAARGHDYRADLLDFVHAVYRLPASTRQLARVAQALPYFEKAFFDFVEGAASAAKPPDETTDPARRDREKLRDHERSKKQGT